MKLSTVTVAVALLITIQLSQADILPAAAFSLSVGSQFLRRLADVKDRLRNHLERAIHNYYRRRALIYNNRAVMYDGLPYSPPMVGSPFVPPPWFTVPRPFAMAVHKSSASALGSATFNIHKTFGQQPVLANPVPEHVVAQHGTEGYDGVEDGANDTTTLASAPTLEATGHEGSVLKRISFMKLLSIRPEGGHLIANWQHVAIPETSPVGSAVANDGLRAPVVTTTLVPEDGVPATENITAATGPADGGLEARAAHVFTTSTETSQRSTAPEEVKEIVAVPEAKLGSEPFEGDVPSLWEGYEEPRVVYGMNALDVPLMEENAPLVFNTMGRRDRVGAQ